jgi:antitoxin component YwqK of YwqJK toxin-antitoxin module
LRNVVAHAPKLADVRIFLTVVLFLIITSCKVEEHYFNKAFYDQKKNLFEGDTLVFPFEGKSNPSQYWKGNLIAYKSQGEMIVHEYGRWTQYNPDNPTEVWTLAVFDTLGKNSILLSEIYFEKTNDLMNSVVCKDTAINSILLRKCNYKWYFDNGNLEHEYSIVTFDNPGTSGKKYGVESIYNRDGSLKTTEFHEPKIRKDKIE